MKTLINKAHPQIRITAPEIIRWFSDFYVVKAEAGRKGRILVVKSKDWTLVEEDKQKEQKPVENPKKGCPTYPLSAVGDLLAKMPPAPIRFEPEQPEEICSKCVYHKKDDGYCYNPNGGMKRRINKNGVYECTAFWEREQEEQKPEKLTWEDAQRLWIISKQVGSELDSAKDIFPKWSSSSKEMFEEILRRFYEKK